MRRLPSLRPRSASTVVAILLLAVMGGFLFLVFSFGATTSESGFAGQNAVSLSAYRTLTSGQSLKSVEDELGPGEDALGFFETGSALEPMDAECIYYPQAGTGNFRDIFQLCFRDDRLVRKRAFAATPGLPLRG
jgi:hypothetical protein